MTRTRSLALLALLAALNALTTAGCRLYFWAGDHELTLPPKAQASPTPEPTPESAY